MSHNEPKPTAASIIAAALKAHKEMLAQNSKGEVFIVFLDKERNSYAVAFILADAEDSCEEMEMCLEDVNAALAAGDRPEALVTGILGKHGVISSVSVVTNLQLDPTLDDQAVVWGITDDEEET